MILKKIEFKGKMIRRDVLRHWPIWALSFLVYVFVVFLANSFSKGFLSSATKYDFTVVIISSLVSLTHILALSVGLAAAWAAFGFFGKKKKDYFYETLPFSRLSLFANRFLFGFIICILPCVAMFFIELIQILLKSGNFAFLMLLEWFVTAFVEYLFWYSLAVLFFVLCGRVMMAGFCYLMFAFVGLVLRFFIELANMVCFIGVSSGLGNGDSILGILSPVEYIFGMELTILRIDYISGETSDVFMEGALAKYCVILIAGIISALAAYFLFNKRKSEHTGDNIAFKGMKYVFCSVISFVATLAMSMILYTILFYKNDEIAHHSGERVKMIILMAVTGFVIYLISSMIVERRLKVFKTNWLKAVIFAVAVSMIGLGYLHDVFNIEGYTPNIKDVQKIDMNTYDTKFNEAFKLEGKKRSVTITDEDVISAIIDIHKIVISDIDDTVRTYADDYDDYYTLYFSYTLNNGSYISRYYRIKEGSNLDKKLMDYLNNNYGKRGEVA